MKSIFSGFTLIPVFFTLLLGCTPGPTPTLAPTTTPKISQEQAVESAIQSCKEPHYELQGEPESIDAQLMTLGDTNKYFEDPSQPPQFTKALDTLVWLIKVNGRYILEPPPIAPDPSLVPPPTNTPVVPFEGSCYVIVDAQSGTVVVKFSH